MFSPHQMPRVFPYYIAVVSPLVVNVKEAPGPQHSALHHKRDTLPFQDVYGRYVTFISLQEIRKRAHYISVGLKDFWCIMKVTPIIVPIGFFIGLHQKT